MTQANAAQTCPETFSLKKGVVEEEPKILYRVYDSQEKFAITQAEEEWLFDRMRMGLQRTGIVLLQREKDMILEERQKKKQAASEEAGVPKAEAREQPVEKGVVGEETKTSSEEAGVPTAEREQPVEKGVVGDGYLYRILFSPPGFAVKYEGRPRTPEQREQQLREHDKALARHEAEMRAIKLQHAEHERERSIQRRDRKEAKERNDAILRRKRSFDPPPYPWSAGWRWYHFGED